MTRSADYVAHHLSEAPILILVTSRPGYADPVSPPGSSIFPAVQNLMLAARGLGLGTTLTTVHRHHEAEVKELLGIPEDVETVALIPVGWPRSRAGARSAPACGEGHPLGLLGPEAGAVARPRNSPIPAGTRPGPRIAPGPQT
jgi:nitroreductase